jgi:peptidoglycan/xylan/chitin deacetylase (PgdA/CDA1 family)
MEGYYILNNINLKISVVVIIVFMLTAVVMASTRKSSVAWVEQVIPISKANTEKKVVAFACNVYEGSEEIDKMLRILGDKEIKITFFLGGVWVNKNKELVVSMHSKGHDLQNHGYYHKRPTVLNEEKNIKEIRDTEDLIYKISGHKTTLFEPPYGDFDENIISIASNIKYKVITWSIDTIDWRNDASKEVILNRIKKKLHPGAIILIHPKPVTADSMEEMINYIYSQGYRITTVSQILNEH